MDKPIYNHVDRLDSNYNLLRPSEKQAQFMFRLRPDAPRGTCGFVVSVEQADQIGKESAIETARALLEIYKKYLYTSDVQRMAELIKYLEPYEDQDEIDCWQSEIIDLDAKIEKLEERRNQCQRYIWRTKAAKFADGVVNTIKTIAGPPVVPACRRETGCVRPTVPLIGFGSTGDPARKGKPQLTSGRKSSGDNCYEALCWPRNGIAAETRVASHATASRS